TRPFISHRSSADLRLIAALAVGAACQTAEAVEAEVTDGPARRRLGALQVASLERDRGGGATGESEAASYLAQDAGMQEERSGRGNTFEVGAGGGTTGARGEEHCHGRRDGSWACCGAGLSPPQSVLASASGRRATPVSWAGCTAFSWRQSEGRRGLRWS